MAILLWIAVLVVAANILAGTLLYLRFRAETQRAAEARHRAARDQELRWRVG